MILALDIGNTNIVIGAFQEKELVFIDRIATHHTLTSLEYALKFKEILSIYKIDISEIDGSIISSVVPGVTSACENALYKLTHIHSKVIGKNLKINLDIEIDSPDKLGSDLIVDAVAVINEYPIPCVIVDMGTATTFSVIDENKKYIGGMILPGIKISLDALKTRTSQLPNISLEAPESIIGKNTIDCMKSGMIYGAAAQIDGIIDRIEKELNKKVTVIATGGISGLVIPFCNKRIIHDDSLLLKGLTLIYYENIN